MDAQATKIVHAAKMQAAWALTGHITYYNNVVYPIEAIIVVAPNVGTLGTGRRNHCVAETSLCVLRRCARGHEDRQNKRVSLSLFVVPSFRFGPNQAQHSASRVQGVETNMICQPAG